MRDDSANNSYIISPGSCGEEFGDSDCPSILRPLKKMGKEYLYTAKNRVMPMSILDIIPNENFLEAVEAGGTSGTNNHPVLELLTKVAIIEHVSYLSNSILK